MPTPLPTLVGKVGKDDDGYLVHTFRQSDIKGFDLCPERGRNDYFRSPDAPRVESAAALFGTAFHAAVEACVDEMVRGQGALDPGSMYDLAEASWLEVFSPAVEEDRFEWGKVKPIDLPIHLRRAIAQFSAEVAPLLDPVAVEVEFKRLLLLEDDIRRIYLNGTIDLLDRNYGVVDWKTASRKYQRWEHQRWGIQPTVYSWAAARLAESETHLQVPDRFTYLVFVKGGGWQELPIVRTAQDWDWLRQKATALAKTLESSDPAGPWLLNDTGWHCSPDWCEKWSTCKGLSYPEGWIT